jgi:hypothetical protein
MTKRPALFLQFAAAFSATIAMAQGPLGPSGPPAPTMKRLDAIDPGRPLDPASFGTTGIVIEQPGSYYLTGNVTTVLATEAAITVLATPVTIDLRGFALIAAGGTGAGSADSAIVVGTSYNNTMVRNGSIRGAWWSGIYSPSRQCAAEDLHVAGTVAYGIRLDDHARVSRCRVDGLSGTGFISSAGIFVEDDSHVQECTVMACDGHGIQAASGASILDCVVNGNTLNGIAAGDGSTVSRCASSLNTGKGIELTIGGAVSDCAAYDNGGSGVTGTSGMNVTNSSAFSSGDRGFFCTSAVFANNVGVRSTNVGLAVRKASSLRNCVAGDNGGDGFLGDSVASQDDVIQLESCAAYNTGQTGANANADGFESGSAFRMTRCVAVNNAGWGLRVTGNVSSNGTVDGNLLIANDAGGITFPSNLGSPIIIRNGVGEGQITPGPSTLVDMVGPYGTAQSDQPFVNF